MSALAKIKKTAAQHEQDRQYDKALAQYARLLDGDAGSDEEVDVALYNRAGDLALRVGDVPRAVAYFERAIDLYAAGGFLNNAVALAVKILRHAPGHLAAHHTLGLLYARKGFRAEARQQLAEYAAHMQRAGRADESRRTLGELAALGAAADEVAAVRELLATRAAGPDDAGALVKGFDEALDAVGRLTAGRGAAAVRADVPLSELIELEVRGQPATPPASPAPAAPRWALALPGDPAPLRLAALRDVVPAAAAPAVSAESVVDLEPFDAADDLADLYAAPATGLAFLDVSAPEPPAAAAPAFELPAFEVPTFDAPTFEVEAFEVSAEDVTAFGGGDGFDEPLDFMVPAEPAGADAPAPAFSIDYAEVESRHFAELHQQVREQLDDQLSGSLHEAVAAALPAAPAASAASAPADGVVDLGEWLRSTTEPASTRLVTPAPRETGDEAADFGAALQALTAGIAGSVDAGDHASHYDLGVAFREMGLLQEAVREFQRALAAPGGALREREALAQCFLDLGRPELALATLERAAADAAAGGALGGTLVGVHYVLAEAARLVGRAADARAWYVHVLAADYHFRDAAAHLAALPPPAAAAGR